MQFKVWLLGLSPMVWRRVHVPATITLRQLHGVIQVAMGWEAFTSFNSACVRFGTVPGDFATFAHFTCQSRCALKAPY